MVRIAVAKLSHEPIWLFTRTPSAQRAFCDQPNFCKHIIETHLAFVYWAAVYSAPTPCGAVSPVGNKCQSTWHSSSVYIRILVRAAGPRMGRQPTAGQRVTCDRCGDSYHPDNITRHTCVPGKKQKRRHPHSASESPSQEILWLGICMHALAGQALNDEG